MAPDGPTGDQLLRVRDGIYADDLLLAGVAWLDVFTWLHEHPADLDELCRRRGLSSRPADVMCTLFRAMGLLDPEPVPLRPSPLALDHLAAGARFDLRPYFASLRERPACREFLQVLTTGEPASWASAAGGSDWESALEDVTFAGDITAAMDARGTLLAPALADTLADVPGGRLLDIAGGSGIYATALVDARPGLHATVVERVPVDSAARMILADRGYVDLVDVVVGDMFDELPGGHDIHLLSHVLHDWDEVRVRRLLAASFDALPSGGWLVDHDAHINAEKTGPLSIARYSALLAHSTWGKCWSVREMELFLADVGFRDIDHRQVGSDRSVIIARKP